MAGREARAQWGFDGWGWGAGALRPPKSPPSREPANLRWAPDLQSSNRPGREHQRRHSHEVNDYVAEVTRESARFDAARKNEQIAKNRSLYNQRQQQLRDNPERRDIELGDALNAAVAKI